MSSPGLLRAKEIIASMPAAWLRKPQKGEKYGLSPNNAKTRLQGYAFANGFCIMTASGGESTGRSTSLQVVHRGSRDQQSAQGSGNEAGLKEMHDEKNGSGLRNE